MRIREAIKEQGFTAKEVADKIGISLSSLNQSISGNPSVKILTKISEVINVPIWQLFVSAKELKSKDSNIIGVIRVDNDIHIINSKEDIIRLTEKII